MHGFAGDVERILVVVAGSYTASSSSMHGYAPILANLKTWFYSFGKPRQFFSFANETSSVVIVIYY